MGMKVGGAGDVLGNRRTAKVLPPPALWAQGVGRDLSQKGTGKAKQELLP